MIDFSEISDDGEEWELFARDFLAQEGYKILSEPDRGPDGGKDLLVSETYKGIRGETTFIWLVSCKHYATSNRSVTEKDELNIQERVKSHGANGFMGFYSTLPSSGLNTRLFNLQKNGDLEKIEVFDRGKIETRLLEFGFSKLFLRYMPDQYKKIYPPRDILGGYRPLNCACCGKDLLINSYVNPLDSIIVFVLNTQNTTKHIYSDVYWCCKGTCDRSLRRIKEDKDHRTSWNDIDDLMIPSYFLDWLIRLLNLFRNGREEFSDKAYEELLNFIMIISQRIFREMNAEEKERANELLSIGYL